MMEQNEIFKNKQFLEMFRRTIRTQFWQHCLKTFGANEKSIPFFTKWFFPKLSTGGVECIFDNSAEKYMRNYKVFFCPKSESDDERIRCFMHKEIFVQNILLDIENATCEMFLWKLET